MQRFHTLFEWGLPALRIRFYQSSLWTLLNGQLKEATSSAPIALGFLGLGGGSAYIYHYALLKSI